MSDRENLFRPIHKGIRSMIFLLGQRMGTTDFTNVEESNDLAKQLRTDLTRSASNCILCLLQTHSVHEDKDFFGAVRAFDEEPVKLMAAEHAVITRRIYQVAKLCDELTAITDPARRIEVGDHLVLETNDLFAFYLAHLNNEEALLVPVMWENFSDEQLRALRAQFYNTIPLEAFEEWMRWTLPALNIHELLILLSGMKSDPPPNRFADAMRMGRATVPRERWAEVERAVAA
ncbi:MAG TPA: hemerythrin domain-containing protein [Thermoplasmata archaeon]|nr:hemerythrin domain-containing protein [Thermoplasmata archaeon]